jgi:hypothetical protein
MRAAELTWVLSCLALTLACGDSGDTDARDAGQSNSGADAGAGSTLPGDNPALSSAACSCKPTEGCVKLNVTLDSASPNLPWKLWPEQNLGEGRLFAGVYGPSAGSSVKSEDVKLSSGFKEHGFDLCVTPSSNLRAVCFLDDKADGEVYPAGTAVTGSSDYRDTCTMARQISVTVVADKVQSVSCVLANSCD